MRPCRAISKDKVVGAVLVSGLAAASLSGVGTASATCIGLSGIDIGEGCTTSLGSFALGIGTGTVAIAKGFINADALLCTNLLTLIFTTPLFNK